MSRAISALRLTPVMFELGARPHPPQELYRAYLAQSDVFVGLYWQQYGWVGPGMEISGLEDEFRLSQAFPRLLYVKAPAPDREPRLAEMLAGIEAEGSVSYRHFGTARELGRLVRDDLATLLSEQFAAAHRRGAGRGAAEPARAAPASGGHDLAGRAGAGHRGGGRSGRPARRTTGDPHRAGWDRQDPARGGGGRAAGRPLRGPDRVRPAGGGHRARTGAGGRCPGRRGRAGRVGLAGGPGRVLRRRPVAADPRQPRAGGRRGRRHRRAAGPLPWPGDPGDQPYGAGAAGGAGIPGAAAVAAR